MEAPDPKKGTGIGVGVHFKGAGMPRQASDNQNGITQSVNTNSAKFFHQKQKLFECVRNNNKDSKSSDALTSILRSLSKEDKEKLVRERDECGNTSLHYAVKAGNLNACKQLCNNGADINARGQNAMTLLQFAAGHGDEMRSKDVWECMQWIMSELEKRQ